MDLPTIGAFARLARLSPKALLRQLDMPLARIAELLDLARDDQAAALAKYWSEQEDSMAARRALAGFLIGRLTGRKPTMPDVHVRDVPARTLLTSTENLTAPEVGAFAGPLFGRFWAAGSDRPFLRYHADVTDDSDGPVEFCCPTTESATDHPDMVTKAEPASREAYFGVTQPVMATSLAIERLRGWFAANNLEPAGPPRQIFLNHPDTAAAGEIVYELALPVTDV